MSTKLKLVCDGEHTVLELDGKVMGKGINAVRFSHEGGKAATCNIDIDLGSFSFLPDGTLEEACLKFAKDRPPEE